MNWIDVEFVKANRGKKRIHVKNPYAINDITLCRYATNFKPAKKDDDIMCPTCEMLWETQVWLELGGLDKTKVR